MADSGAAAAGVAAASSSSAAGAAGGGAPASADSAASSSSAAAASSGGGGGGGVAAAAKSASGSVSSDGSEASAFLHDLGADDQRLLEPYAYMASVPGKGIRSMLIAAFNKWLQVPAPVLLKISRVVAMLHTSSLVVDDIEDSSRLRRGVPCAHTIYGDAASVNSANMVYFLALRECASLGSARATRIFIDEMIILHRGQGCDIFWRDTSTCPSEAQYVQMVLDKTGGLFRLAVRLMIEFATAPGVRKEGDTAQDTADDDDKAVGDVVDVGAAAGAAAAAVAAAAGGDGGAADDRPPTGDASLRPEAAAMIVPLVEHLGVYFQIRDDYINLVSEQYHENKSFCEDLTEGKFSFPIIACISAGGTSGAQLSKILQQRTEDIELKKYALKLMHGANAFEHTRETLSHYESLIRAAMEALPPNPLLEGIVRKLTHLA